MKSCPSCNRTYPDDTLAFCLVDGAILSAPYDPKAAQHHSQSQNTEPPPTEAFHLKFNPPQTIHSSSSQSFIPERTKNLSSEKQRRKRGLILGTVAFLLIAAGVIIALGWSRWAGSNDSQAKQSTTENMNNMLTKTEPSVKPSITPQSTPSPKSTPSQTKKIDVTGTWTGTFANRDAFLFINSQDGDSFSGILKNSKKAIISVSGHINSDTRQISMRENRVVEEALEGPSWILGSDSGSISTDGKRMSGNGKDKAGHSYSWSFAK